MMVKCIFILITIIIPMVSYAQCKCEKITRDDGSTVRNCNPLPFGGDKTTQIGLSAASNDETFYITLTIRFKDFANDLYTYGKLSIMLDNNNIVSAELINQQQMQMGNSQVTQGIFALSESQVNKLTASPIKTVSFKLSDGLLRMYQGTQNKSVLKTQLVCLK